MKVTLSARYVTWIDEANPTRCFFNKTGYAAVDGTSGKRKQAILWFSSPFGPEGGNVLSAVLTVKTRAITGTGTHTMAATLAAKWSLRFGQLTWNTKTGTAGAATTVSRTGAQPTNAPWTFDMTAQLQAVADGQGMYGVVLSSTAAETLLVQGQMGGGLNPTLTVEWTLAPKPPAKLAPSGGRSVGTPKPVLRWDFFDHAGEDLLQSVQVQTSTTSSFTAPDWDSGEINTHWCTLDLSTTSHPGLAAGQTVWWRVRNRDSAGLWSSWSSPASFRHDPLPAVALQNPSAATPFIVDPTPPIDWIVTGGTQAAYRVGLYVWDGRKWGLQDASGYRRGTETSWTPTKALRYRDGLYKVTVDVFDALDREATPDCQTYASDSQEVRFKPDTTTTSVYNLTATSLDGTPAVDLAWTQPQQPDRWHIYRDGKLLANYAGDALLRGSAPNYGITDRWVPQGEHTWRVHAIVNGESWKSGSITAAVHHTGTWLVNTDTQQAVCIVGDVEHDMTLPEDVTVHTPLGARHSIAITGGRRGYEGTVNGLIVDTTTIRGSTIHNARAWRDNLLAFKTDTGQEYLLLIEDLALPVRISNVDVSGVPGHAGEAWQASFAFRQIDDFLF